MATNPFSTCFFQPGSIEYQFFGRDDIQSLTKTCLDIPKAYLIVGPHGSGKSTLLRSLQVAMDAITRPKQTLLVQLASDGTANRMLRNSMAEWSKSSVVLLDGLEQLSWWNRVFVAMNARWRKRSIVATTHSVVSGFQLLWQTSIDKTTEQWVVARLLHDQPSERLKQALESKEWDRSRQMHGQNLRESLFDMYDWWQKTKKT